MTAWGIVCFGDFELYYGFVLKRHLDGLRKKSVFKLPLTSTPRRCGTILAVPKSRSKGKSLLFPQTLSMFQPQVRWDSIARINDRIQGIVPFGVFELRHDFVLKRRLSGLREECVFKLSLTSTPRRCETILVVPEHNP